jgi:hypothetical protein
MRTVLEQSAGYGAECSRDLHPAWFWFTLAGASSVASGLAALPLEKRCTRCARTSSGHTLVPGSLSTKPARNSCPALAGPPRCLMSRVGGRCRLISLAFWWAFRYFNKDCGGNILLHTLLPGSQNYKISLMVPNYHFEFADVFIQSSRSTRAVG